ncbi:MAG: GntR family transcriptional regulator [Nakamurella sp.]
MAVKSVITTRTAPADAPSSGLLRRTSRLRQGEWKAERLPTKAQLTAEFRVSRSTVRAALQLPETQGRTKTRHGIGTLVTPFGREFKTGLQELQSMSETIRVPIALAGSPGVLRDHLVPKANRTTCD